MDFYSSSGKYKYSTKFAYKSTKNGKLNGTEMMYKKSGCKGSATSGSVSLSTTCTGVNAYTGM